MLFFRIKLHEKIIKSRATISGTSHIFRCMSFSKLSLKFSNFPTTSQKLLLRIYSIYPTYVWIMREWLYFLISLFCFLNSHIISSLFLCPKHYRPYFCTCLMIIRLINRIFKVRIINLFNKRFNRLNATFL